MNNFFLKRLLLCISQLCLVVTVVVNTVASEGASKLPSAVLVVCYDSINLYNDRLPQALYDRLYVPDHRFIHGKFEIDLFNVFGNIRLDSKIKC